MVFSTNHTKLPNIIQPPESLEANKSEEIVIYSIVLVVIFVSSVVGNFLVTLTLWRKGKMSPSNRFVFSLVFSNFMKDITIFPLIVTSFIKAQWIFGHAWCDIIAFLFLLVSTASILTTAAIAIDRYCAIVKTMVYRRTITSTKSLLMLLLTWTQAFCCSVPPFFGFPG
ncbi:G-protein coupled receptor 161-like isoform X2 [Tachypleus tridentatus]|uniref:G-protein coupled receptor 161-like isoform X2 n=1 Tax=Tachypleus tridentatus TaxID=6853 RepID=UPI003FD4D6CC